MKFTAQAYNTMAHYYAWKKQPIKVHCTPYIILADFDIKLIVLSCSFVFGMQNQTCNKIGSPRHSGQGYAREVTVLLEYIYISCMLY